MPLTIPDQTIASQVKVPDMLNTLSSIANLKNAQQQLQTSKLDYQTKDTANAKLIQLRDLVNDPNVQNPDGTVNQEKFAGAAFKVDPTQGAAASQGGLANETTQIANKKSQFNLTADQYKRSLEVATSHLNSPPVQAALDPRMKTDPQYRQQVSDAQAAAMFEARDQAIQAGVDPKIANQKYAGLISIAKTAPETMPDTLKQGIQSLLGAQGQAGVIQPTLTDNGQQQVNVNPLATPTTIQKVLPPSTPVIGPNNTPGYLGSTDQPAPQSATPSSMQIQPGVQAARDGGRLQILQQELQQATNPEDRAAIQREILRTQMSQPQAKRSFVASGLPIGSEKGIDGTHGAINTHWDTTQASAGTAQQDIGVLQNIKQHAAGAATGVAADRQALAAGIAGLIGISPGELVKTNSDLLAKNSNMLALAGGDTNLARTMAEAATPNSHMTKEAIIQAADQVIAQRKLALARREFLTPFKAMADQGHPEMYNNALNQFNSVADPRVIQFKDMSNDEKIHLKSSMTPQERSEFGAKLAKARQLGIAQ